MVDLFVEMAFSVFDDFTAAQGFLCFIPEHGVLLNFWLWQFLGRLHPMIVHFPIGLLVVAFILELFSFRKKKQGVPFRHISGARYRRSERIAGRHSRMVS